MHEALDGLKFWQAPEVLVGIDTYDDAGIFRLDGKSALVQTLDFFTPVVDDPHAFGAIATANALSDVYAMGGTPATAMNILCVPPDLPPADLRAILQGGADKLREARCSLLGGHTVRDAELKFGCSVTGFVDPAAAWTNAGAKAGSRLVLTKPLGSGILGSAIKQQKLSRESLGETVAALSALNKSACEAGRKVGGVRACTDITGFGLAGHAGNMAKVSRTTIRIDTAKLPIFPDALALARGGLKTGGDRTNRLQLQGRWKSAKGVDPVLEVICFDPQTSGGLLLVVDPDRVKPLVAALKAANTLAAHEIGEVLPREGELDLRFE